MADLFAIFEKLRHNQGGRANAPTGPVEFLVVGLGNPGAQYERTRHNAGFLALEHCAAHWGFRLDRIRFKGLCGEAMIEGRRVLFLKPSTFMNHSGEAVCEAARYYKLTPEQVLVLYDDISLEVGSVRIRRKGSDGGHNGIKSILSLLGADHFPRVKLGVGKKPHPEMDLADWVLSRFTPEELKTLTPVLERVPDIVTKILTGRMDQAMNEYNS